MSAPESRPRPRIPQRDAALYVVVSSHVLMSLLMALAVIVVLSR